MTHAKHHLVRCVGRSLEKQCVLLVIIQTVGIFDKFAGTYLFHVCSHM